MSHKIINQLFIIQMVAIGLICPHGYSFATDNSAPKAIIIGSIDPTTPGFIQKLQGQLEGAGYSVTTAGIDRLANLEESFDLIVLADASSLPLEAIDTFQRHFASGGDIVALRAPMWKKQLIHKNGEWVERDTYLKQQAFNQPGDILFDFSKDNPDGWQREAGKPELPYRWTTEIDPVSGRKALRVQITDLEGFDNMISPRLKSPFGGDSTLTILSARGTSQTTQLAIRWEEVDGSRWTTVIPLSQEWRQYILHPQNFRWSGGGKDRENTAFNPSQAVRITFVMSWDDTGLREGPKEYWISGVSTAPDSSEYKYLYGGHVELPDFDSLAPSYKLFPMSGVGKLTVHPSQGLFSAERLPTAKNLMSPHQRPQGNGFDKGREWRWIPILEGRTSSSEWRGTPATMTIYSSGGTAGSIWSSFGIQDESWYNEPDVIKLLGKVFHKIYDGVFIMDGGADLYTYTNKQDVRLGLKVTNLGPKDATGLVARINVHSASNEKLVFTKTWELNIPRLEVAAVEEKWRPKSWPANGYIVCAELLRNGIVIDKVQHEISLWRPKSKKSYVTIQNGQFMLNQKPWRVNGLNYHPSSTVSTWDWSLFLEWFGKRSYDPEVIERDLSNMKKMGVNTVSVQLFYSKDLKADNLLDFFRRLDKYGIKANLALPLSPMTELETRWAVYKDIVENYDLKNIDTIIAYDIDWEPTWLTTDYRKQWDDEWEKWIIERYGSIENAEADWGFPVPRDTNGKITNPTVQQTQSDGEWRRMSAAYRRFLNTILYRQYSTARRLVREVDPNHPVSFRMHAAGDGGCGWYGLLPYDWSYLAGAVDFFGPEAYTLGKTWDKYIKRGLFTRAYANWADKDKPVMYAEAGYNIYEYPGELAPRPDAMNNQYIFYRDFYRMIQEASINGVCWWWFPGGFRCMENSDYGVINPDGSDRPVTKLIRKASKSLYKPSPLKQGKVITVDPEAYISSNEAGSIYDQIKDSFWTQIENGFMPVISSPGKGTDSSNCPLVAVGNTPYNGKNPPKYLDAWFDLVEILYPDGKWHTIRKADKLSIDGQEPIYLRANITNLGDAKWLAGDKMGCVSIAINGGDSGYISLPVDVPHLGSIIAGPYIILPPGKHDEMRFTLRMEARDRASFGDVFTFTIN